jgi:hypothetical protein
MVDMKARSHLRILSLLVAPLGLTLVSCKREPPALAATPLPIVMVSQPVEREITDYNEYTGRTAAVETVEVRARGSGYLVKVNFQEGSVVKSGNPSRHRRPAVPARLEVIAAAGDRRERLADRHLRRDEPDGVLPEQPGPVRAGASASA